MAAKVFKTIDEQLEILKTKGLIIEDEEETKEILSPADVFIRCNNCATIHFLENHIKEKG